MKPKRKHNIRVAELIREKLSLLIPRVIHDPRLGFVTITNVELTGDERKAYVFYTVIGDAEQHRKTSDALADGASRLRRELGRVLRIRHIPELFFQPDPAAALELGAPVPEPDDEY